MSVTMRFGNNYGTFRGFGTTCPETRATCPRLVPLETRIRAAVRRCIAEEIERLLLVLDGLDVDADYEDGGDAEVSLGWSTTMAIGATDDREEDAGDEGEPDEDQEPSLGWQNPMGEQSELRAAMHEPNWGLSDDDRELDEAEGRLENAGDEREPDEDREPSLGWSSPTDMDDGCDADASFSTS